MKKEEKIRYGRKIPMVRQMDERKYMLDREILEKYIKFRLYMFVRGRKEGHYGQDI